MVVAVLCRPCAAKKKGWGVGRTVNVYISVVLFFSTHHGQLLCGLCLLSVPNEPSFFTPGKDQR